VPSLYLAPLGAAGLLVAGARLPRRARSRWTVAVCVGGAVAGAVLAVAGDGMWRSTSLAPDAGRAAGTGIACAWVLAAVLGPPGERWRTGALVGASSAGLALFAGNQWVAPALLFWVCSSAALVALLLRPRGHGLAALVVGAADAAFVGAVVGAALDEESWRVAEPLSGWPRWLALGALLMRAGIVPRVGVWQSLRSPAAACLPLLVAGSFVVMERFVGGPLPWLGVALLAGAIALLGPALTRRALVASTVGAWPVLLMLAAVAVTPPAAGRAGVAACLSVAIVAAWPSSAGRARMPRGLGLAFLPPFVGFGVVLSAAVAAFDRAAGAPTSLDSVPWTGAAAILPIALAGGVVLGLNATLQSRAAAREGPPAIATWAFSAAALLAGVAEPGAFGNPGRVRVLYVIAAAVGVAAVYVSLARRHEEEIGPIEEGPGALLFDPGLVTFSPRAETALTWAAAGLVIGAAGCVGWLTFEGLRTGFLS
jgi:hypothetical protein